MALSDLPVALGAHVAGVLVCLPRVCSQLLYTAIPRVTSSVGMTWHDVMYADRARQMSGPGIPDLRNFETSLPTA